MTTNDDRWLPMTIQWLYDYYPMTIRWLYDDYPMTIWWQSQTFDLYFLMIIDPKRSIDEDDCLSPVLFLVFYLLMSLEKQSQASLIYVSMFSEKNKNSMWNLSPEDDQITSLPQSDCELNFFQINVSKMLERFELHRQNFVNISHQ